MGTTTTTNLALIKPDVNESIEQNLPSFPGWTSQYGSNLDTIDALFRASTHTWSPSWTGTSNPTLGSGGFVEGKYIRLFPRMVIGFFRIFTGGSGFAAGTGGYSLTPPLAMASELTGFSNELCIGKAAFLDFSATATCGAFNVMYSTVGGTLFLRQSTNDVWTATSPVALAQNDRLSGYFMYPTSVA